MTSCKYKYFNFLLDEKYIHFANDFNRETDEICNDNDAPNRDIEIDSKNKEASTTMLEVRKDTIMVDSQKVKAILF